MGREMRYMNKLDGKNPVVDANVMHNNHCEYDTLMTFFSLHVAFPLNSIFFLIGNPDADEPFTLMCVKRECS